MLLVLLISCTDVIPFINRTSNKDSKRREITLIDEDTSVSITLWDEQVIIKLFVFFKIYYFLGRKF